MNKQQALWACFELGLVKLELRKWIYRERKDKIDEILGQCIQRALEKYDESINNLTSFYDKPILLNKFIYIPDFFIKNKKINSQFTVNTNITKITNYDEIIKQPLEYIIFLTMTTTYTIVDSIIGPFMFFTYMYDEYAIFEPLDRTCKFFTEKGLSEYIKEKYKKLVLYTIHSS